MKKNNSPSSNYNNSNKWSEEKERKKVVRHEIYDQFNEIYENMQQVVTIDEIKKENVLVDCEILDHGHTSVEEVKISLLLNVIIVAIRRYDQKRLSSNISKVVQRTIHPKGNNKVNMANQINYMLSECEEIKASVFQELINIELMNSNNNNNKTLNSLNVTGVDTSNDCYGDDNDNNNNSNNENENENNNNENI